MAVTTPPVNPEQTAKVSLSAAVPFDMSQPPVIEGFNPLLKIRQETFQEKFIRKTKENPFVPIGCLATAGMLLFGLRAFHLGKTKQSQFLMRGRVFAQGFTLVAFVFGIATSAVKSKQ